MARTAWIASQSRGSGTRQSGIMPAGPGQVVDVKLAYTAWTQTARTVTLTVEWSDDVQLVWRHLASIGFKGSDPEGRDPANGGPGLKVRTPEARSVAFVRVSLTQAGTILCGVDGEVRSEVR